MRDKIKNCEYYSMCISYEQDRIDKFIDVLKTLDESNTKGIENANLFLSGFYRNLFRLKYSAGFNTNEIFKEYLCWINYYKKVCTRNDSLYDLVDMFAIGVFFEKRKNEFLNILLEIFNKCQLTDGLIIFFLRYLQGDKYQFNSSEFDYFEKLYLSKDKENDLKECIVSWYQLHKDAYWFNSHKSVSNTYCGYWSFDIGAIAKILDICDKDLVNAQYYPYDLVHNN